MYISIIFPSHLSTQAVPIQQRDDLKSELADDLTERIISIRERRRWVEEQWLRGHRAWMNLGVEQRFRASDSSNADYTLPVARRAIERTVVRGVKMLTPNVKWFEVNAIGDVDDKRLANVDAFMWYILRKKIKSKTNISQLIRCMVLYGRCHLRTSITVRNGQVWPSQRVVDPFAFYTFPETGTTADETDIVFEDFLFSYEKYKTFVSKGIVEDVPTEDLTTPDWPYHLTERLSHQGLSTSSAIPISTDKIKDSLQKVKANFVSVTEMWLPREDSLYQVYIVWNCTGGPKIVGFFKSEYDEPLYKSAIHRGLPSEAYTNSMMDDIVDLQALSNDQLNQFQDSVNWEQGFVAVNNSAVGRRDSWKAKGRAIWEFSDDPRNAMQFLQPPVTSTNQLRAWQIYLSLINSLAGTGTIAEGQPGRNMPRAGGAVNNLVNLSLADVQDLSEMVEQEVLTPSIGDIHRVCSQFIPDHQLMKIPGGESLFGKSAILKRDQIVGDYEFDWVGSLQYQDEQVRAQRMMIFLNMIPQLAPLLEQQGYTFNIVELIQNIWRYSLGERSLSKVVMPIGEMQQEMLMRQAQDMVKKGSQGGGQGGGGRNGQSPAPGGGMAGLQYNLPSVTSGFVQNGGR
jgi:hypothetical protein